MRAEGALCPYRPRSTRELILWEHVLAQRLDGLRSSGGLLKCLAAPRMGPPVRRDEDEQQQGVEAGVPSVACGRGASGLTPAGQLLHAEDSNGGDEPRTPRGGAGQLLHAGCWRCNSLMVWLRSRGESSNGDNQQSEGDEWDACQSC